MSRRGSGRGSDGSETVPKNMMFNIPHVLYISGRGSTMVPDGSETVWHYAGCEFVENICKSVRVSYAFVYIDAFCVGVLYECVAYAQNA